jgi:hypothetical protein
MDSFEELNEINSKKWFLNELRNISKPKDKRILVKLA